MKKIILILIFITGILSFSNKISVYIDDKLTDFNEYSFNNWKESDATKYNGYYGSTNKKLKVIVYQRSYGTFVNKTLYHYNKNNKNIPVKSENLTNRYVFAEFKNNMNNQKGILVKRGKEENYDFFPYMEKIITLGKFPNASLDSLLQKDLKKISKRDMKLMRNEIYARYGYIFSKNGEMDQYFRKQEWYEPKYKNIDIFLTELEKNNITYMKAFESPVYYEDQYNNDFLEFYDNFTAAVSSNDYDKIKKYINFPLKISGGHDGDTGFILKDNPKNTEKLKNIFKYTLYSIEMSDQVDKHGRPELIEYNNILNNKNYFDDVMISRTGNSVGKLYFENIKGKWKLISASVEPSDYENVYEMLK